ncbi:AraC family transcriptional regulator [Zhongshania sp. BJYM1]|jgi:AraC-like DNA-binding protein|uniref:AraC family transcriptional regulator n=1 Tax=Zhongshania aquatica TaxID=2965069 RepID=UPI0022B4BB4D|nr:AraC family transcriptional regulator [Marortus sp. BJYM1]
MFFDALARSKIFENTHPEVVSDFVNKNIGRHKIEILDHEAQRSSLSFKEFLGLGLTYITYGNNIRVRNAELENMFHLQIISKGKCEVGFKDEKVSLNLGDAIMLSPGEKMTLDYSCDCKKLIINVPESLVRTTALGEALSLPGSAISFKRRPLNLFAFPSMMKLFETILLEAEETGSDPAGVFNLYREILAKKLLFSFKSNVSLDRGSLDNSVAMQNIVQYIDENLKNDIDAEDLAEIANVSARSIYNGFANAFSTTPRKYIKDRKLKRIRDELISGSARNITEVAFSYGLMHLGRFSSDYKKLFGELPSETKRLR